MPLLFPHFLLNHRGIYKLLFLSAFQLFKMFIHMFVKNRKIMVKTPKGSLLIQAKICCSICKLYRPIKRSLQMKIPTETQ